MATPLALPPILVANTGDPFTGDPSTFVVTAWNGFTGASRPAPTITQVGATNLFVVHPTDGDEQTGTVILVDVGAANTPRYNILTVDLARRLCGYGLYDANTGAPWTPSSRGTITTWTGGTLPTTAKLQDGLCVIQMTAPDVNTGAQGILVAPNGALPESFTFDTAGGTPGAGGANTPPSLIYVWPSPGSTIAPSQKLSCVVQDDEGWRRVLLFVEFPDASVELAYDGQNFVNGYDVYSTMSVLSATQTRYALLRKTGWLQAPTVKLAAIDTGGNELS